MFLFRGKDSHPRSIVKAISWRVLGSFDTFVLSTIVTGNIRAAGAIASIETVTKVILYYFHERAWTSVQWGQETTAGAEEPTVAPDQNLAGAGSTLS
jgi:uncharacterized membrane protein